MSITVKTSATLLTISLLLLGFTLTNIKITFSESLAAKIDLFTQKEPYSGKGPNMPSDAFGLEEVVILYALVTYNKIPVQNSLVAFHVTPPNFHSFSFTASTNSSGIAMVAFTTPVKSSDVSEVFGEWLAIADTAIGGQNFQDTLAFRVDWVVKLLSIRTIDENLNYRTTFGKKGDIGLEITLRSIAMTTKKAALAVAIKDEVLQIVNSSLIRDFYVMPNEKPIHLYCKLHLPDWTRVGVANVSVSAFTAPVNESGVAYCPSISTEFIVRSDNPLTLAFHDVAVVEVVPSASSVEKGQHVNINTVIQNEGTEPESFNVTAYYDSVLIGTLQICEFAPYSKETLTFIFNTSLVSIGKYTITVSISHLVKEADVTDNDFIDGIIKVELSLPKVIHDIAIIDVKTSSNSLYVGESLYINVTITNIGNETETFYVDIYYNSTLIGTLHVESLEPREEKTLKITWDTEGVMEGSYVISAYAHPVEEEINEDNNLYIDGVVQVKTPALPPTRPLLLFLPLLLIFLLLLLLLTLLLANRRRKKRRTRNFIAAVVFM